MPATLTDRRFDVFYSSVVSLRNAITDAKTEQNLDDLYAHNKHTIEANAIIKNHFVDSRIAIRRNKA